MKKGDYLIVHIWKTDVNLYKRLYNLYGLYKAGFTCYRKSDLDVPLISKDTELGWLDNPRQLQELPMRKNSGLSGY